MGARGSPGGERDGGSLDSDAFESSPLNMAANGSAPKPGHKWVLSEVSETTVSKTAGKEALIIGFPVIETFYVAPSFLVTSINQKSYRTPVIQRDITVVERTTGNCLVFTNIRFSPFFPLGQSQS